jgi:hypothetical protein
VTVSLFRGEGGGKGRRGDSRRRRRGGSRGKGRRSGR